MNLHPCPLCGESKGFHKSGPFGFVHLLLCGACNKTVACIWDYENADKAWNAAAAHAQGLRERIAELEAVRQWLPIETAPRQRRFLALVDGLVRFVAWGKTSHVPMYGWCLVDQGAEDSELCEPTHWMPLPPPPVERAHGIEAGVEAPNV